MVQCASGDALGVESVPGKGTPLVAAPPRGEPASGVSPPPSVLCGLPEELCALIVARCGFVARARLCTTCRHVRKIADSSAVTDTRREWQETAIVDAGGERCRLPQAMFDEKWRYISSSVMLLNDPTTKMSVASGDYAWRLCRSARPGGKDTLLIDSYHLKTNSWLQNMEYDFHLNYGSGIARGHKRVLRCDFQL